VTNSGLFCAICNDARNNPNSETVVMCTCGWKDRIVERETERHRDFQTAIKMGFSAVGVFVLALHFIKWGGDSFSIPFYRLGQVTGMLSGDGYLSLARTCISAGQWECAENAYLQAFLKTKNPDSLATLASLQLRQQKNDLAIENYSAYVKNGGRDIQAHLEYAALLESKHRVNEAMDIYKNAIEFTPANKLPVQATAGLVRLEIKMERYTRAMNRILEFHELAPNAKGYLNTELDQVRSILKNRRKLARR
jgi:tetratricopeptide (TPR) repeat protein